jgi:hypothetical protein
MNPPPLLLIAMLLGMIVGFGGLGAAEPAAAITIRPSFAEGRL